MSLSGKDHRDAVLIACGDDFIVFLGSTGLDDSHNAGLCCSMDGIGEGEECVGSEDTSSGSFCSFGDSDFDAIDSAHLAGTDADEGGVTR